ncbi:MAG: Mut7-C RNAse domain-containing protein [Thermodesulfobacteriota bacterium]
MTLIAINFHGDLGSLLNRKWREKSTVAYRLERRASIKDIIESLGIPHTEIDRLITGNRAIDFHHIPETEENISVFPVSEQTDFFSPSLLRPIPLPGLRFIADVNTGKLAKNLRLLGFDTLYGKNLTDNLLAETAAREKRIVLSKDKGVLMRKTVIWGHLVRSDEPEKQLTETIRLFRLKEAVDPFTRCQHCNCRLTPVAKKSIYHLLEPLTQKYYHSFQICENCGQIYWAGSHRQKMDEKFSKILS